MVKNPISEEFLVNVNEYNNTSYTNYQKHWSIKNKVLVYLSIKHWDTGIPSNMKGKRCNMLAWVICMSSIAEMDQNYIESLENHWEVDFFVNSTITCHLLFKLDRANELEATLQKPGATNTTDSCHMDNNYTRHIISPGEHNGAHPTPRGSSSLQCLLYVYNKSKPHRAENSK